jgi:hypothetical protein
LAEVNRKQSDPATQRGFMECRPAVDLLSGGIWYAVGAEQSLHCRRKEQNETKSLENPFYGTAKADNKSTARDKAPPKAERQEHLWRTVK